MDQPQQPLLCPTHTAHYIIVSIVSIALGVLAGWFFTYEYFEVYAPPVHESDYQAGFDAAKKRVEGSEIGSTFSIPSDIRTLSGVVTVVKGGEILIHTQEANPLEPWLDDRTILINADTKVFKLSKKDQKTIKSEMDAFMNKMQSSKADLGAMGASPNPFVSIPVDVSSIAVGDRIDVSAVDNIRTKREFTASEIQIQPTLVTK